MTTTPINILLVDDDARNLDALESILVSNDYALVRAASAEQALETLLRIDFALIVLDVRMPTMSGLELAQIIKQRKKTQHIPIIFLTAYFREDEHVMQGYGAGAVDYISKPCNPDILRSKVAVFVELYRQSQDITERKRVEEALRKTAEELARSNRELEQFAYIASHDLQEPLRMISAFVGLLKEQFAGKLDEEAASYFGFVVEGAERMRVLIHDLLEYSRVGSTATALAPVNVQEPFETALDNLRVALTEAGAIVTSDPLPTVAADGLQLTQLLQNLIGNAIKFRGKSVPEIHIGAERKEDHWHFTVRDNGIGIDPQFGDKIFGIFQRLHTREKYPGTGVGLAVCKKIVEYHGGRIWVESAPGSGATFHFTIPDLPQAYVRQQLVEENQLVRSQA